MKSRLMKTLCIVLFLMCSLCICNSALAQAAATTDGAAALRQQYTALLPKLSNNQFKRPLYLHSEGSSSVLSGDIYAMVEYPFTTVNRALNDPEHGAAAWCDVLLLHPNTKYCRASGCNNSKKLTLYIGKKEEQPLSDAHQVDFSYRTAVALSDYFQIVLMAATGPLDTKDYSIALEAVAINGQRTFLHLTYSYIYGMAGSMAMKTYLATIGRNKVGFTGVSRQPDGQIDYIGGVRGVMERNTMRYYLAIDAYLSALSLPADKQLATRLSNWFDATEQYARQLHEMGKQEYMQMKFQEYQRQQKNGSKLKQDHPAQRHASHLINRIAFVSQ